MVFTGCTICCQSLDSFASNNRILTVIAYFKVLAACAHYFRIPTACDGYYFWILAACDNNCKIPAVFAYYRIRAGRASFVTSSPCHMRFCRCRMPE